jgi:hypothetical protein
MCGASPSASATGRSGAAARADGRPVGAAAGTSSTNVFHSPQPGQRPCHLALSCAQALQTWTVRGIPPR